MSAESLVTQIDLTQCSETAPAPLIEPPVEEKPVDESLVKKDEVVRTTNIDLALDDLSQPKMPRANRRLSARLTGWAKGFGKKEGGVTPKDEVAKEDAELKEEVSTPVADKAPTLDQPVLAAPIKIEEVRQVIYYYDVYSQT